MTVAEMIEYLKDCDQDAQVFADYGYDITYISSGADEDTDEVYYIIHTNS